MEVEDRLPYRVEYDKSGKAKCWGCKSPIDKNALRLGVMVQSEQHDGKIFHWYRFECFFKKQRPKTVNDIAHFNSIRPEDQEKIREEVAKALKDFTIEYSKSSTTCRGCEQKIMNKEIRISKKDFDTEVGRKYGGKDMWHHLDCFAQLRFDLGFYESADVLPGFEALNENDQRNVKEQIPAVEPEEVPEIKKTKTEDETDSRSTVSSVEEEEKTGVSSDKSQPKVIREKPALYDMEFVILGKPPKEKDQLKAQISKFGGKVITKISPSVMAVISTPAEVEKMGSRMSKAEKENVHVVSEDFVKEAPNYVGKIPELVTKKSICNWGSDPNTRLPAGTSKSKSKSQSIYDLSKLSKLKGGDTVDPYIGLENEAHVYQDSSGKYTAVLSHTDIEQGKNSYYIIQLLAADEGNKYWVFRAWGKIGTTIGSNILNEMSSLQEAKTDFCKVYKDKTGNMWENKDAFVKVPGKYHPIDSE